jgi:hypothetical protein
VVAHPAPALDEKLSRYRAITQQSRNDLLFWQRTHGSEYAARRLDELNREIESIEEGK